MLETLNIIAAVFLFLLGLRLSAFFSGAETGFYRVSYLRLTVDAHAGDQIAQRLISYANQPSYFVATTLVGNNVANYLTTLAIGLIVAAATTREGGWLEIAATLLLSPLIFLFGELVPKNLYYRAPMALLRKDIRWFHWFYRLFLPISLPLIGITKLLERFSGTENKPLDVVLGRNRLVHVLSQGHRAGLLTNVQSRLINGLMLTAAQTVNDSMTPAQRVLGVSEDSSRDEVLEHARRYGLSHVPVHRKGRPGDWYGYLRVIDLAISDAPLAELIVPMPEIAPAMSKLKALLQLRQEGRLFARVTFDDSVVGIINERGLIEQMFRTPQSAQVSAADDHG